MNDTYKEILVKRRTPMSQMAIKYLLIALSAILILGGFLIFIFLIPGAILGIVTYFVIPKFDVEYEYLYVNGSFDVDAIYSKQKRKRLGEYNLDDLEIAAPENSHALDSYKNNQSIRKIDYTSGEDSKNRYALVYSQEGIKRIVYMELDDEIIADLRRVAPRKVNQY